MDKGARRGDREEQEGQIACLNLAAAHEEVAIAAHVVGEGALLASFLGARFDDLDPGDRLLQARIRLAKVLAKFVGDGGEVAGVHPQGVEPGDEEEGRDEQ